MPLEAWRWRAFDDACISTVKEFFDRALSIRSPLIRNRIVVMAHFGMRFAARENR